MRNAALWCRLQAHTFDAPGGTQPYSVKLALAEGWDADYTAEVIEEYRRFIYLTQVSETQVTPSIAVDRAWHMHLTFTRDYWEVLCPQVLGQALHHEPCAGEEEMPRYHRQFDQTRDLYREEFGTPPPAHIWGGDAPRDLVREHPPKRVVQVGLYGVSAGVVLMLIDPTIALLVIFAAIGIFLWEMRKSKGRKRNKSDGGTGGSGGCGGCGSGGGRSSKGESSSSDGGSDGGGGCGG